MPHAPRQACLLACLALIAGGSAIAGCGRGQDRETLQERAAGLPREEDLDLRRETRTAPVRMGEGTGAITPAAVMEAQDLTRVYPLASPALVRIERQDRPGAERALVAEAEAESGDMLVLDRGQGIRLGGREVMAGPLVRSARYLVYVLPPGGVRQEASRTTIRPPTQAEIEAAMGAREAREEQERREAILRRQEEAQEDMQEETRRQEEMPPPNNPPPPEGGAPPTSGPSR